MLYATARVMDYKKRQAQRKHHQNLLTFGRVTLEDVVESFPDQYHGLERGKYMA
jgi:hypothetical protein